KAFAQRSSRRNGWLPDRRVMLNFFDVAKAQVTQSLTAALLEAAGYRVSRFGIEEVFNAIKHLDTEQYRALSLPHQLRLLPDLLIAEPDLSAAALLEVKFRARFDEQTGRGLHERLSKQLELWPGTLVALYVGRASGRGYIQDHLRVLNESNLNLLIDS